MNRFDKHRIAASFDRAADGYEERAVLQKTVTGRLIARLDLVTLKPGWVLDVGAGTGGSARALASRYRKARVLQLDLSRRMLQISRRRGPWLFSRHHYFQADAEALPIAAGAIDLVFSSLVLQWCNDLDRVFAESARVLAPNGLFIFATLGPDTLRELRTSWAAADGNIHVNTFFDMHDIGDAVVRAGLEGVVMDVEHVTMTYPDCLSLMHDLKSLGAHNMNEDRHRGLTGKTRFRAMQAAYEQYRHEGRLPSTYEIVYGHGWAPATGRQRRVGDAAYVPVEIVKGRRRN